jgi:hypothetical protein
MLKDPHSNYACLTWIPLDFLIHPPVKRSSSEKTYNILFKMRNGRSNVMHGAVGKNLLATRVMHLLERS